ncbi:hypothetical protein EDD86DRAFT_204617 [Gorgonomyces haynaldii]|nr:hypothetical protein EDD86DRAFT_204617 [Gorgonomyces haynaldii]
MFIQRRFASIIPPRISSIAELGRLQSKLPQAHPELFSKMKHMYKVLPKGNREAVKSNGFFQWYFNRYIESNSAAPILHFLGVMIPMGYYIAYFKGGHYHPRYEFH